MVLLITGCILVDKNMPFVKVNDSNERLDAYCQTILWAIQDTFFDKIVFCENSGYDFDSSYYQELAKKFKKEFEYLTFSGNREIANQKGKGYGEGEIVLHALKHSKFLKNADAFCKITGRLKISNVNSLIHSVKKNYFMNKRLLKEVDTRFYCIQKKDFWEHLKDSYQNVNDHNHYFLEHAYYDSLKKGKVKYRCFYEMPLFQGISGSTGKIYTDVSKKSFWQSFVFQTNLYNQMNYWKIRAIIKKILVRK